ncbi:hypothetical protein EDB44_11279 [Vibrio crassostreae]|uniref:hypothetical protein n=1 Tax=Vibrio crassostreae TaxID=246167 RepID=UPI00104333BD|nr:hypothetical protein [Vibrio crassostreae]TCT60458.1 hypothetical protein EDB44_11279 [Vibrio crassostreae]TCT82190.1 hypothetical protein EDB43_11279 [Vibrio crassostreae]
MAKLFFICNQVFYSDDFFDFGLNEVVVHDIFEAKSRKEAEQIFSKIKIKTLRSGVIQNRLKQAGYNVRFDLNPRLDHPNLFSLQASGSLRTQYPDILSALKAYSEDLEDRHLLKNRIELSIKKIEQSKTWTHYELAPMQGQP